MAGQIQGIYTPHMIPFDEQGRINESELRSILEFLIEKGISGLYPNGSTGEFTRLTHAERKRVIEINCQVSQQAGRDVPVLAGAYEANIDLTVDTLNYYADLGARAGALIAPYYFPMSQDSIRAYFEEVANKSRLDLLLYNIPQFSNEISIPILIDLCQHPRVIGTKDSSRDLPRFMNAMHKIKPLRPDFTFLIGCEEILLASLIMGGDGGTIATSGVIPEMVMALYHQFKQNNLEDARRIQFQMLDLIEVMLTGCDFPEGFRAGMAVRGFNMGRGRQHQSAASQLNIDQITRTIQCLISEHGLVNPPAGGCPTPATGGSPGSAPGSTLGISSETDSQTVQQIVAQVISQLGLN